MKTRYLLPLLALLVITGCSSQTRPTNIIIREPRTRVENPQAPLPTTAENPAPSAENSIPAAAIPVAPTFPAVAPTPVAIANPSAPSAPAAPSKPETPSIPAVRSAPEASATPMTVAASPFANAVTDSKAKIKVLGVFFVPSDMPSPTDQEIRNFQKHLVVAQANYKKMLLGRDTFTINSKSPYIYHSPNPLAYFQNYGSYQINSKFTIELLKALNVDRNSLTDDLAIVVMDPKTDWPKGAGRPINGGVDNGAGILAVASNRLDEANGNFQGTLEHELGHTFGLVHTDTYGYSQSSGDSIMSYNHEHRWTAFTPPAHPGILIPEDIRTLAENKKVFPNLYFDPKTDVPKGYDLKKIKTVGPAILDIQVSGYTITIDKDRKNTKQEPNYTLEQALADFWKAKQDHPNSKIDARYDGNALELSGKGYEVYSNDGKRIAAHPNWTYNQAMKDLQSNIQKDPEVQMVGLYDGKVMQTD